MQCSDAEQQQLVLGAEDFVHVDDGKIERV